MQNGEEDGDDTDEAHPIAVVENQLWVDEFTPRSYLGMIGNYKNNKTIK